MAYYIIYNNTQIFIAERAEALTNLYPDYTPQVLPADYNSEKYQVVNGALVLNPDYDAEQLARAKANKYEEANSKAFEYLESGEAIFTYEEGRSIEATDGNIAKLGLYLVKLLMHEDYTSTIEWNTKENENVQLNAEQLSYITEGLGAIQTEVWTVKFPAYNAAIEAAETVEEVNAIEIDYSVEVEAEVEE